MKCACVALVLGCTLGLPLLGTGASAQGVSITPDNQILVELAPEDTTAANLFDLSGSTLVFTPDGQGGYSRSVQPLAWEENLGEEISEEEEIALGFPFEFGSRTWDSFHVSKHGALTFGAPLAYRYDDAANRFDTMKEIAAKFVTDATISPLFKPGYGGITGSRDPLARQLVAHHPDRVVVTWFASEPHFYAAFPPEVPDRFQAVLSADGSARFHYGFVAGGDGVAGLFPDDPEVLKGNAIAMISDPRDPELPGHLDLIEAAIYETAGDPVIVEFTELRMGIDVLRSEAGLPPYRWTDPALTAGVTRVRLVHLLELREALAAAYAAAGRPAPVWTDAAPAGGTTPIRAAHLMELRTAVRALE